MYAVVASGAGGPDVLSWQEVPEPRPAAGEVLIDVVGSAVNRADLLQRRGFYPPPPGVSEVLGLECSGRIAALGAGVAGLAVGDEVCALLAGGGYAERAVVPAGQVMPVPAGVDLLTAAALPEVVCTVWSNLAMVAGVRSGDWVLIHGGAGGIGTMAVQLATALGATVAVTAGSADRLRRCAELGAQLLIDYHEQDFVELVQIATGGRGVDVILDNMGASYLSRNVTALARHGRLVVVGLQGGVRAELDLRELVQRHAHLVATSLRARPLAEKAEICHEVVARVWPMLADGRVKPVVDRVLPMHDAAAAHRALEDGGVVGKIVLSAG
ncbi:MAG: NAD(P)H-quinone oxidoreductase [Actinomycetota bacterium]|nr:MAG: NAD(P)H-quinone oxidoreductase [Actinomycetota bacterium]